MYSILNTIHSFVACIFVFATIASVGFAMYNKFKQAKYSKAQLDISKVSFITSHIQLLIGLALWIIKGYPQMISADMKGTMSDAAVRMMAVEHPLTNIIAILILTLGYVSIKKASTDDSKQIKNIIYFGLALILILSRIPWNAWIN